jgi:predicted negative regulator of RcsB-dependent stress response
MFLVLIGLVLIALSVVWPMVSTGRSRWTDEQALAYQSASAEVHRLSMQAANMEPEEQTRALRDELANAESKYAALRAELDAARGRPSRIATVLRYLGIALLIGGLLGLVAKLGNMPATL